jgi:hypothetical protein
MFANGSRYAKAGTYTVTLPDGTPIAVTRIPLPVERPALGWHRRTDAERLELLAFHYLRDATAAWALGWANGAMSLDALAAHELVAIPRPD